MLVASWAASLCWIYQSAYRRGLEKCRGFREERGKGCRVWRAANRKKDSSEQRGVCLLCTPLEGGIQAAIPLAQHADLAKHTESTKALLEVSLSSLWGVSCSLSGEALNTLASFRTCTPACPAVWGADTKQNGKSQGLQEYMYVES